MSAAHEHPWRDFRAAMSGPRMHHGWILAGKRGLGKGAFALAAAREYVGTDGLASPTAEHPDILRLSHLPKDAKEEKKRDEGKPFETKRNISVDQIRAMQARLTTRPTLGDRRAIIIDPADDLEKGASNALLKSLEEPPAGTIFLLVTHRPGRLLATIRSRCRMLRFATLEESDVARELARDFAEQSEADRAAAIAASGGSPGAAAQFLELGLARAHAAMTQLAERGDAAMGGRAHLVESLGARPSREKQLAMIELARSVLAARMRLVAARDIPALVDANAALSRLAGQAPTYNFDAGLLALEIGTLLADAAPASERADA